MEEDSKFEKFLYISLILLGVFVAGVQIGIHHGRELQMEELYYQEYYEYIGTN